MSGRLSEGYEGTITLTMRGDLEASVIERAAALLDYLATENGQEAASRVAGYLSARYEGVSDGA